MSASPLEAARLARFRREYAAQRAAEGRGAGGWAELFALPYLSAGPTAEQWRVRARSYRALERMILRPMASAALGQGAPGTPEGPPQRAPGEPEAAGRGAEGRGVCRPEGRGRWPEGSPGEPPELLDLGAGNGWLSWRAAGLGWRAVALDLRDDAVDGLGAAVPYLDAVPGQLERVVGSFQELPLASRRFDLVVFNASLHYALDLRAALTEAQRVTRRGGRIVILDSPWYRDKRAGEAMVVEKRRRASESFGPRAAALTSLPFIEYLTSARIKTASAALGLRWQRHRVRYPIGYELRPLVARLKRRRPPSRFDLWEALVP